MDTSEQILQSDILCMFEARQSQSIKSRDGFLKTGVEALNAAPIDGIKFSDLAKISGDSVGNFCTRFQDKDLFLCALRSYTMDAIDRKICADFTPERLRALPNQEALDGFDKIRHIFKLDDGTVLCGLKEVLSAYIVVTSQKEILMAKQPNIIDLHRQSTSINAWLLWEL